MFVFLFTVFLSIANLVALNVCKQSRDVQDRMRISVSKTQHYTLVVQLHLCKKYIEGGY